MKKHGDKIKDKILNAGLKLWPDVSARGIGRELKLTHSAVLYHFGNSKALGEAVASHAVAMGKSAVIVELIAQRHKSVAAMPDKERQRHLKAIS